LRTLTLLAFLLVAVWSQPGAFAAATKHQTPANGTASHSGTQTDGQIQQTIAAKLAKSKIGQDGFKFHVQNGVVTWEGTTNVMQHKGAATRMAKAAGATKVVNNIQVSAAAKAKATQQLKHATVK
jgi:hypothetical protein